MHIAEWVCVIMLHVLPSFFLNGTASTEIYTLSLLCSLPFFFFNDTATTEIYTLSLHDALPISQHRVVDQVRRRLVAGHQQELHEGQDLLLRQPLAIHFRLDERLTEEEILAFVQLLDRKSTRLNSSH